MTGWEGAVDVVWQDAVPSDEICTGVQHLASTVWATSWSCSNQRPVVGRRGQRLAAWLEVLLCSTLHAFPQLCAAVMDKLWVLTFPASRYRALAQRWCLSSWSAAHRPTGCPSPFHPIRLMLAGPARTQSELGRSNVPSSRLLPSSSASEWTGPRRRQRARVSGYTRPLRCRKHLLAISTSTIISQHGLRWHRQVLYSTVTLGGSQAALPFWGQSSIG